MVSLQFFTNKILLEDFHLEGPAVVAGLDKHKAILFSKKVIKQLKKDNIEVITLYDLIKYSAGLLKNKKIRKKYIILNQYFLASYDREIDEPFFLFLGGASSAGKDLLAAELQNLLGIDRVTPADVIREAVRSDIIKKYGDMNKVPEKLKPVFKALYRTDEKGWKLQTDLVDKKMDFFINEAYRECQVTGGFHAFFIFHGTHMMPGIEKKCKGKNKLSVVIDPSEKAVKSRILARWEREYGAMTKKNEEKRFKECETLMGVKKYVLKEAKKHKSHIIQNDNRLKVLHKFGDILIGKLEKILIQKKVKLIKI
jgi:2-phosphoglycerate kinase